MTHSQPILEVVSPFPMPCPACLCIGGGGSPQGVRCGCVSVSRECPWSHVCPAGVKQVPERRRADDLLAEGGSSTDVSVWAGCACVEKSISCFGRRRCVTEHEGLRQAGRQAGRLEDRKANPRKRYCLSHQDPTLSLPCWWANVRYAAVSGGAGFGVARLYARAERRETNWDRGVRLCC